MGMKTNYKLFNCNFERERINVPITNEFLIFLTTFGYNGYFSNFLQLLPYLVDHTGSRSISKVKLRRALLVLRLETSWEHRGAVVSDFLIFC